MGIRLKDLSKLGYRDNVARSLVVDIVGKYCKHDTKEQIAMTLSNILEHPESYKNNEIWSKLAERLSPTVLAKEFVAYDLREDPMIKIQVLSDELCARIFYDAMRQFIRLNLEKQKYNMQKSQSEQQGMELVLEWSETKRKDGWQALLQEVADKHEGNGFDKAFYQGQFGNEGKYADEEVWERMVDDWKEAFQRDLQEQKEKEIEQRKDDFERRLHANLRNIPGYIRQNNIEKDEFYQAWGLMSGMWNTVDFERIRKIVRIQKEYPEVVKVANKMGRMADDEGQEQLHVA